MENGKQSMYGLNYEMTAWRHGEEAMDPFHDEVRRYFERRHDPAIEAKRLQRGIEALALAVTISEKAA